MKATGKAFLTDANVYTMIRDHVDRDSPSDLEFIQDLASDYWSGEVSPYGSLELLFRGTATTIKQLA